MEMGALTETTDVEAADVAARRWLRSMRRIDGVTIAVRDGQPCATLRGVSHRLPITRRISLLAAAGLCRCGVPLTIEDDAR